MFGEQGGKQHLMLVCKVGSSGILNSSSTTDIQVNLETSGRFNYISKHVA